MHETTFYKKIVPDKNIRTEFINLIESDTNPEPILTPWETVSKASWENYNFQDKLSFLYQKNLSSLVANSLNILETKLDMNRIWYHIYDKNSSSNYHYHTHDNEFCQISGIYYLKLKSKKLITNFCFDGGIKVPDVSEGDLILFDSSLPHNSPPNNTKSDKIIIAFNLQVLP